MEDTGRLPAVVFVVVVVRTTKWEEAVVDGEIANLVVADHCVAQWRIVVGDLVLDGGDTVVDVY